MTTQTVTAPRANTPAPAPDAVNESTLALAVRALAIVASPPTPPAVRAAKALENAIAALRAAGGAIPPQAAATLALLGGSFNNAATNRPAPGLILTGPKAYAAQEIAHRMARASGAPAYLPTQYVVINPASSHRKVYKTGGWFRSELARVYPLVADLKRVLAGHGATELNHNLIRGYYMLSDAPIPAARHLEIEAVTDAEIAAMKPEIATWAIIARDAALRYRDSLAAAATVGGV
jgi:hypothetical protein